MFDVTRALLKGLGLGAGAMYLFDPMYGPTRRSKAKGQVVKAAYDYEKLFERGVKDVANRVKGAGFEAKGYLSGEPVDDATLVDRVRSTAGHAVSDAGDLVVTSADGVVTLAGTVRPGEPNLLIPQVEKVRGVRSVENRLVTRGEPVPYTARPVMPRGQLTPATRLGMATVGLGLMGRCLRHRSLFSLALGTAGFALFQKGRKGGRAGNFLGMSDGPRNLDVEKTIHIDAPPERVYDYVTDVEASKRFFPGHWEVKSLGDGHYRWTSSFAGAQFSCEEVVTEAVPNETVAWRSTPGSAVPYEGIARFEREDGGTRVSVRMSWNPPGGVLAGAAARAIGLDPKSMLDEAMKRAKMELEGHPAPTEPATA